MESPEFPVGLQTTASPRASFVISNHYRRILAREGTLQDLHTALSVSPVTFLSECEPFDLTQERFTPRKQLEDTANTAFVGRGHTGTGKYTLEKHQ